MLPDKVILDDKSFKALSAESRVSILKNLNNRRMTLSELSKRLSLEASTIKEHCTLLVQADLIKQIDEGRKWKYYELTGKGKSLIEPNLMEQVRVLVVLCFGAIMFGGIMMFILSGTFMLGQNLTSQEINSALIDSEPVLKSAPNDTALTTMASTDSTIARGIISEEAVGEKNTQEEISREFFVASITLALISGLIMGWFSAKKY